MALEAKNHPIPQNHQRSTADVGETPHTAVVERNSVNGRFVKGCKGGPGRSKGSTRKELAAQFVDDLHDAWGQYGVDALKAMALTEPSKFVQCVAHVLPRDIDVTVDVTLTKAIDAASAFALLARLPKAELLELKANANETDG